MMRSICSLACLILGSVAQLAAQEPALKYPIGVAVDAEGAVYVADKDLPGIWKIVDGKRELYFQGSVRFRTPLNKVYCLAVDGDGRLLAGDSATREVYRFSADRKPEPLTHGFIGVPVALAVASDGSIHVADLESQRIWTPPKEGLKEGESPKETALLAGVRGLAFDPQGALLAVTTLEDPIRRVAADGKLEVVVPGRPFELPHQIVVGKDGSLFVTDNYAATIWQVPVGGGAPTPFAKGPPLNKPVGLTKRGDDLLVADPHAKTVFVVTPDATITPLPGAP